MSSFPLHHRLAGVLLHPTSLPSGGMDDAFAWLDFIADAGLRVWQVLPLGHPHADHSPYQCLSAFALNPALLPREEMPPPQPEDEAYALWCRQQAFWLEDYVLFISLKHKLGNRPWYHWPDEYKFREQHAMQAFATEQAASLQSLRWQQYQLYDYWQRIHHYARQRGIHLFGDMPIYVAHDSAEVWAHRERFLLDAEGSPQVVAGVPPDYFSETGQRWGNPHYDWQQMEAEGFRWWLERLHNHFEMFDLVRLDHFRGLEAVWMIEASCETAVDGHWQKTPGDALLGALADEMGEIPLIAEDLGVITAEVTALRKRYHLPGMAVLQFGFDYFDDNPHKPHNIHPDTVVYTGTHDNDTCLGWFRGLDAEMQLRVKQELGITDESQLVDAMIERALHSRANLAILPLQDLLKLGSEARMNIPGTTEENWGWRCDWTQLTPHLATSLRLRIEAAQRSNG